MKKAKDIFKSISASLIGKRCAYAFAAVTLTLSVLACTVQLTNESDVKIVNSYAGANSREVSELSGYMLSLNNEEVSSEEVVSEETTAEETTAEITTAEKTTVATTAAPVTQPVTAAPKTTQAATEALAYQSSYTFSQLGISQMSDIAVPDDIKFDANGIPLNYSYKVTGNATAYNMGTTTATGTRVHPGVVAVNPRIIPYGSKMYIVSTDGSGLVYGYSSAEDTGGFIYWSNAPVADVYVNSYSDACVWGKRQVAIYVF